MKTTPKQLRALAEKRLAELPPKNPPDPLPCAGSTEGFCPVCQVPTKDVQRLVHELQVHEIELEMQNEGLRLTQSELETARDRLMLPYDAAPVGFLTLDAKGVIQEANLAAAKLLDFDRVKLPGQRLTHFIAPESQDTCFLHRRLLFNTGEEQTCELRLVRADGAACIVQLESVMEPAAPGAAPRCLVMLSDVTARKQAEDALLASNAELTRFNQAAVGRELRMIELKKEINDLCAAAGQPPRYRL